MTDRSLNSFAFAFERLRTAQGLRLGDVADRIGYSASYLSKILHGHRTLLPQVVQAIDDELAADGELVRIAAAQTDCAEPVVRPVQLPPTNPDFLGRAPELAEIDTAVAAARDAGTALTVVIEGSFWIGKTELAVHWAARAQPRFPGGCLFADLRGLAPGTPAPPERVLDGFLRALGAADRVLDGTIDERIVHYRSLLAERPAIVVLDNAVDYAQVRPLLPGPGSVTMVTSREHQGTLLAQHGGLGIELAPLGMADALELLRRRIGRARVDVDLASAETVVRRAGGLPMAILIAAEHVAHRGQSLHGLADSLQPVDSRLAIFASPDPCASIYDVVDLSYLSLSPQAARVFRLLGAVPLSTVTVDTAAAVAEIPAPQAESALHALRGAHLIERAGPGRLQMNDLLRAYAHRRASLDEPPGHIAKAVDRLRRWYAATGEHATDALAPHWTGAALTDVTTADITPLVFADCDAALAWLDAEAAAIMRLARTDPAGDLSWQLPAMLLPYHHMTRKRCEWLAAASDGLAAARRVGSRHGTALGLLNLGLIRAEIGHVDDAATLLANAWHLHEDLDAPHLRAWTALALANAHRQRGDHGAAQEFYDHAGTLFTRVGYGLGRAVLLADLAGFLHDQGDLAGAATTAYDALTLAQASGHRPVLSLAHHRVGLVLLGQGATRPALTHLDKALALRRASRERWAEADTMAAQARTLEALGLTRRARDTYRDAARIFEDLHDPRAFDLHNRVAAIDAASTGSDDALHPAS
ncbi:helix-turn-helix domain-containing protein [Amycolatopsis benzoatilytica]|uniref:helix-turn-helix domain-containing protein n=1 Tax=Amycolatopsis benzoatilytica TaxID=346045 RepID=UPI00038061D3|nr:helix-turn-helix domain-containing protein [Amycolatopsis benzoatilytica]